MASSNNKRATNQAVRELWEAMWQHSKARRLGPSGVIEGTPFEHELARRLDAHTERVSEVIFQKRGLIDEATMQMLLDRDQ